MLSHGSNEFTTRAGLSIKKPQNSLITINFVLKFGDVFIHIYLLATWKFAKRKSASTLPKLISPARFLRGTALNSRWFIIRGSTDPYLPSDFVTRAFFFFAIGLLWGFKKPARFWLLKLFWCVSSGFVQRLITHPWCSFEISVSNDWVEKWVERVFICTRRIDKF